MKPLKKTIIIMVIIPVLLFSIYGVFTYIHSGNIKNSFIAAQALNAKSYFGSCVGEKCELLTNSSIERFFGSYQLEDAKSEYYYSSFGDSFLITDIYIKTSAYHVFGIRVGDDLASVDEILKEQGYRKGWVNSNPRKGYPIVSFKINYIQISFYVDPSKDISTITEIRIVAHDPI